MLLSHKSRIVSSVKHSSQSPLVEALYLLHFTNVSHGLSIARIGGDLDIHFDTILLHHLHYLMLGAKEDTCAVDSHAFLEAVEGRFEGWRKRSKDACEVSNSALTDFDCKLGEDQIRSIVDATEFLYCFSNSSFNIFFFRDVCLDRKTLPIPSVRFFGCSLVEGRGIRERLIPKFHMLQLFSFPHSEFPDLCPRSQRLVLLLWQRRLQSRY